MTPTTRSRRRSRLPLALAMGAGLTALATAAGVSAVRRAARSTRDLDDPHAADADAFDLDALGVTRHRIPAHDGGEIHVVEKGPADGRPLVLLHGITLQARIWGYQLRDLSDRFRVVAVDLRGHGESRPGTEGFGLDRLANDLVSVLEHLDLHHAIVVGHSMGGMALMRFCGDHPAVLAARVDGVVFLATAPLVPLPAAVVRMLERLGPTLQRTGDQRGWHRMPKLQPPAGGDLATVLARRAFGARPSPTHVALTSEVTFAAPPATTWPSGLGLVTHDAEEALAATHTPSLVIGGELDNITPVALSHRIAELLPHAELHVFDGAGHMLMLERHAEVDELLEKFAARVGAPA